VVRPDSAAARSGDTVRVVVSDSVLPQWSATPIREADRLASRQMYETLVRINCEGALVPGAAEKWVTEDSGRTWTFTLRDSLRFWDGTRYTAADFVGAWSTSGGSALGSADTLNDRTIRIRLTTPEILPWDLDRSSFSLVTTRSSLAGWPLGTGPYRPDTTMMVQALRLLPVDSGLALPILEFWQLKNSDPRDLLDHGAEVMFTTDPSLIDYADKRGDRNSLPLPWNRTYFLLYLPPLDSLPPVLASLTDSVRGQELRRALSRDAVRAESRPASRGSARQGDCLGFAGPCHSGSPVILYPPGDRTAKDLAERLVALVPGRFHWSAVPMGDKRASRGGIGSITSTPLNAVPANAGSAIPLVDVRSHAILRRGSPAWVVDGDGVLRMPLPGTVPP